MIDRLVSNIEKSFNKNNIQLAFQLINELKIKYPQSKRVRELFKKINLNIFKK